MPWSQQPAYVGLDSRSAQRRCDHDAGESAADAASDGAGAAQDAAGAVVDKATDVAGGGDDDSEE